MENPLMILYWYWQVKEFPQEVFSTKSMNYVADNDPDYLEWLQLGGRPAVISSGQELGIVLVQNWMPIYFMYGLSIISAINPSLNGIYAIQDTDTNRISSIATGIAANKGLPGGSNEFYYSDMSDSPHLFNQTEFLNFAKSIENFIYNLRLSLKMLAQHGISQLPEQPVNIDLANISTG